MDNLNTEKEINLLKAHSIGCKILCEWIEDAPHQVPPHIFNYAKGLQVIRKEFDKEISDRFPRMKA